MTNRYQLPSTTPDFASTATIVGLGEEAAELLDKRCLDLELLSRLGWRSGRKGKNGEVVIEIPYFDESGKEVNVKTRTITGQKQFHQQKGARKCFYNLPIIAEWQKTNEPLIITEGEMDCIAAIQAGYMAVSVPDGAPAKEIHDMGSVKYSYLDDFPKTGSVIIAADNDPAGQNLLNDLVERLGAHRCKWIDYGSHKDLNDVLMAGGTKAVSQAIDRAKWVETDGNYLLTELPPIPKQLGTGLGFLPINIRRGDFSVVTGIPNHGKSTVVNYMAHTLAKEGWVITFASFEQPPQTHHRHALRTLVLGYHPKAASPQDMDKADQWIDEHYNFIVPNIRNEHPATLEWLMQRMANALFRYGTQLFVIDPWNEMEHARGKEMTQTEYTGFAIRQLKQFATRYQVHIMVVAHPAKMQRAKQDGKYPVPTLYDIADSAHWANKSDLGMIVHRGAGLNETTVIVQKSRYYEDIGEPGEYPLMFDPSTKIFDKLKVEYSIYG